MFCVPRMPRTPRTVPRTPRCLALCKDPEIFFGVTTDDFTS